VKTPGSEEVHNKQSSFTINQLRGMWAIDWNLAGFYGYFLAKELYNRSIIESML
jgi:hypothetical protein